MPINYKIVEKTKRVGAISTALKVLHITKILPPLLPFGEKVGQRSRVG